MTVQDLSAAIARYADVEIAPHLSEGRRWAFCGAIGAAGALLEAKTGQDLPITRPVVEAFFRSAFAASPRVQINLKDVLAQLMPGANNGPVFDMIASPLNIDVAFDQEAAEKLLTYLP